MSWLFLAIVGHVANAAAFLVDKVLLTTTFKKSVTYAVVLGILPLGLAIFIPWIPSWPALSVWPTVALFGSFFVFALWAFFEALRTSEASRVVPLVGSLVPVVTLIGTSTLFGERLTVPQLFGFVLFLMATLLLTGLGRHGIHISRWTFLMAVVASVLFASSSVAGKFAFNHANFWGVLIGSRLFAGLTGVILFFLSKDARTEILRKGPSKTIPLRMKILAVCGHFIGTGGFLLIQAAIARGSASLVNALQATQYGVIALMGWFGGKRLRSLLQEERTPLVIAAKSLALVFIGFGLWLITL